MKFQIPKFFASIGFKIHRLYYQQIFQKIYLNKHPPSWFDHRIDLYANWPHNLFWLERGIFARKYMFEGCSVLDLFCGDGFFSRYFYSTIASRIDAVDKDPSAIAHARRHHHHNLITFTVVNAVTEDFPQPHYDIIVWFEGIEHLHVAEYREVITRIQRSLSPRGTLIGSTPLIAKEQQGRGNWEHHHEFSSVEELTAFLSKDFGYVDVYTTIYPSLGGGNRHTAYFVLQSPFINS
ncbi:hypothetical protein CSA56_17000 [candidate division KSB3 bacterium]|uniref:Methyltransferase domain-containing protein n=1 Tax=candidate division KSB3 bacterium TaxID=2044937 RepID=A0A2G6K8D2_9BACT|nr:MAG: hypothetical protein CSA56_17000 [candidate division KSB3 bacterium]